MIRAEIVGHDRCNADGITVHAAAPVLAMCRKLIEAGYDSTSPLEAYRDSILCLRISSIGWGAGYTVADNKSGTPALTRWRIPGPVSAPPMSPIRQPATLWPQQVQPHERKSYLTAVPLRPRSPIRA
jgi:hypothetical protein